MISVWERLRLGAWAVVDQGIFAGSNFALNLLLARWLGAEGYGAFSVSFTVFLMSSLIFTSLAIEPMLVFGASTWRTTPRAYFKRIAQLMLGLSVGCTLLLLSIAHVVSLYPDLDAIVPAIITLSWAAPCTISLWLLRRASYVLGTPQIAATGGVLYLVLLLAAVAYAYQAQRLDAATGLAIMGLASILAAGFILLRLNRAIGNDELIASSPRTRQVITAHWTYGRWLLLSSMFDWFAVDMPALVLTPVHGLASVGSLRAAYNLVLPALHAFSALGLVAIPWFIARLDSTQLPRHMRQWWALLSGAAVLYAVAITALAGPISRLVYGGNFDDVPELVRIMAFVPIAYATQVALGTELRARARSRDLFLSTVAAAVLMATLGAILTVSYSTKGAALAILFSSVASGISITWRLAVVRRRLNANTISAT